MLQQGAVVVVVVDTAVVVVVATPVVVVVATPVVVVVATPVVVVVATPVVVVVATAVVVVVVTTAVVVVVVATLVVVVIASVVVVGGWVVVVVVVAHGLDDGWQSSVILVLDCPAFALILHDFVPFFFAFTLTATELPHMELVPLALTLTFPPCVQPLEAWIVFCLRSFAVQPAPAWLTHSASWKVHVLPTAVAQSEAPSATKPLVCSWNSVGHWPCAWPARGANPRNAAAHATTSRRPGRPCTTSFGIVIPPAVSRQTP